MAEIIASSSGRRSKRRPIPQVHLDMTPLVDLGFLLLTFFILTTHLLDQRVMNLTMPVPGPPTSSQVVGRTVVVINSISESKSA